MGPSGFEKMLLHKSSSHLNEGNKYIKIQITNNLSIAHFTVQSILLYAGISPHFAPKIYKIFRLLEKKHF